MQKLGSYLNRNINYINIPGYDKLVLTNLTNSIVLILLNQEFIASKNQLDFLEQLIILNPLGIVFWGKGDELGWNKLIDILSVTVLPHHIMTYRADGKNLVEVLEDMLFSKIPAGEMFDEWKEYVIISIGSVTNDKQLICEYLKV